MSPGARKKQQPDGRTARGARSRETIIDALFELVGQGILRPTAQDVATRAGVGIRTVFRHFRDMDSLYVEIDARLRAEMQPKLESAQPTGNLEARARDLVAHRSELFELVSPYKRSTELLRWNSEFLTQAHRQAVRDQRADLLRWLPELELAPDELAQSIELVTSFESWDRLRSDQKLGAPRARAAVERTVVALLRELPG
jgi:AcrR family transcriptional regulator